MILSGYARSRSVFQIVRKTIWLYAGVLFLCLSSSFSYSAPVLYRLGVNEEMPSNHLYHVLVDRHGYLWMSTSHSVVRYNGYETKLFDLSSGLPSNDIWGLHEDAQGRIWVLCFCHALGYIMNNEFFPITLENPPPRLYPRLWNFRDRIMLQSQQDALSPSRLYVETDGAMSGFAFSSVSWAYFDSTRNELFYTHYNNEDDKVWLGKVYKMKITPGQVVRQLHYAGYIMDRSSETFVFDRYSINYYPGQGLLCAFDMVDRVWHKIPLHKGGGTPDNNVVFNRSGKKFWIHTADSLYEFNDALVRTQALQVPPFIRSLPLGTVLYDRFWGSCFGTSGQGLYIAGHRESVFREPSPNLLPGYRYVGHGGGSMTFGWREWDKGLVLIDRTGGTTYRQYSSDLKIIKIVPWTYAYSLVLGIDMLYLLEHTTGRLTPFVRGKTLDPENPPLMNEYLTRPSLGLRNLDLVVGDTGELFLLSRSGLYRIYEDADTLRIRLLKPADSAYKDESYVNLVYDPFRKALWAYNNNAVLKYGRDGQALVFKSESQLRPEIRNIEQILVDKRYGNFFLKEFDRIRMHDVYGQQFKNVYPEINLQKTVACITDDLLVVAGRFGVAFSRILGYGQLSDPVVCRNVKKTQYGDVYNVSVVGGDVIINTDKGLLSVPLPDSLRFDVHRGRVAQEDYRLLLKVHGSLRTIVSGDTLQLDQEDMKLYFDLIRPEGSGTLKYAYRFPEYEKWNSLEGKELLLPPLKPGTTTRMLLRFSDDVWVSGPLAVDLYVIPYWWQTVMARRVLWIGAVLGFLGLIAASAWITRRIVVNNNQRRNAHMEIELKALYAQINPHFIFNTLNTALFFIETRKIEDAHTHVSRFSSLLRSYIKSSRNRFVTIAEEIENLHNYIGLQQIRFWDKFDYKIRLEDGIEAGGVRIPALLFQPLVENAIHHGLFHKKEKGFLSIHFKNGEIPQEIICIIEDDGVGRRQSREFRRSSTLKKDESYGDQLIGDLIRIFNKYEGMDIRIAYHDKEAPQTGTIVTLYIKKAL